MCTPAGWPCLGCTLTSDPLLPEMFDKQQANTIFWSPQGAVRRAGWPAEVGSADALCGAGETVGDPAPGPEGIALPPPCECGAGAPKGVPAWVDRAVSPSCCPDVARTEAPCRRFHRGLRDRRTSSWWPSPRCKCRDVRVGRGLVRLGPSCPLLGVPTSLWRSPPCSPHLAVQRAGRAWTGVRGLLWAGGAPRLTVGASLGLAAQPLPSLSSGSLCSLCVICVPVGIATSTIRRDSGLPSKPARRAGRHRRGSRWHRRCLPSMNAPWRFVDTCPDCTVMNIAEHYMASRRGWDPTGALRRHLRVLVEPQRCGGPRRPCLLCLRASPSPRTAVLGGGSFRPFRGPQPGPLSLPGVRRPPLHSVTTPSLSLAIHVLSSCYGPRPLEDRPFLRATSPASETAGTLSTFSQDLLTNWHVRKLTSFLFLIS